MEPLTNKFLIKILVMKSHKFFAYTPRGIVLKKLLAMQ